MIPMDSEPIYLTQGCVKVKVNGADKYISVDSFLEILDRSISADRAARTEDMFPPRGMVYFGRTASKTMINCYYPGGVRNIKYGDHDRPSVIPNIIVAHTLVNKPNGLEMEQSKYFCTDLPTSRLPRRFINGINHAERIFLLPFTNTYDGGNMCYGSNTMPRVFADGNLRGLDWYYDYMFESPFNNDLGLRALGDSVSPGTWYRDLARIASEGGEFPYNRLSGFTPLA